MQITSNINLSYEEKIKNVIKRTIPQKAVVARDQLSGGRLLFQYIRSFYNIP